MTSPAEAQKEEPAAELARKILAAMTNEEAHEGELVVLTDEIIKLRMSERAACDSRVANLMGAVPEKKKMSRGQWVQDPSKEVIGWNAARQALISADRSYTEGNGV